MDKQKKPNYVLRHERVVRGWTQHYVAEQLGADPNIVSRWERGERPPGLYYQEKLCQLFGKSAAELGLIQPPAVDDLLEALRVILQGVQAMPKITRRTLGRKLLELGTAAVVGNVAVPSGRHISTEDRTKLHDALSQSIIAGWKLFHTAGNAQVLAIGQAQLYLVQQNHAILPSRMRSEFYSSVYNLIGESLKLQGRYHNALEAHVNAHVAAMSTGNPRAVVRSLICQADSYQRLGLHIDAIEVIEEANRLIGNPEEESDKQSKAQLLALWTENALTIKNWNTAQEKLEEATDFIDGVKPNEQFDRASWFQLAGKLAFAMGDYRKAIDHLESARKAVAPTWIVRQILILLPLLAAYTWEGEREACLAIADVEFSTIRALNAPTVNKLYKISLQGLLEAFPYDNGVRTSVVDKLAQM
jgi:transcriptional regulator with XRE-family HTH domain/ATP/maltotriose-dependent transcriptional regulator MalT